MAVLRWPDEDVARRALAARGQPRILVTAPDVTPPSLLDELEAWIVDTATALDVTTPVTLVFSVRSARLS